MKRLSLLFALLGALFICLPAGAQTINPSFLPTPTATTIGAVKSSTAPAHEFAIGVNTSGIFTYGQPAFSDLSGNPSVSQLGASPGNGLFLEDVSGTATWATPSGGGNPTVNATVGSGGLYSLTQSYANTGVAATVTSGDSYLLTANVEFNDTSSTTGGDDLRAFLYDSTAGVMVPWSEQRTISPYGAFGPTSFASRPTIHLSTVYTAPGNDTIQLWATNATKVNGTVTPWRSKISVMQVSGSSNIMQISQSNPVTSGLVSDYNADSLGLANGASVSTWSDAGSAGLTASAGAVAPTYITNYWNGHSGVKYGSTTNSMTNASQPTTNLTFDMWLVCSICASTTAVLGFDNGANTSGGYGIVASYTGAGTAYAVTGDLFGVGAMSGVTGLTPRNGIMVVELQRSGTTTNLYVNGTTSGSSTSNTPSTPSGGIQLGGPTSSGTTFIIMRALLYNAPLSGANQSAVFSYLQSLYGE